MQVEDSGPAPTFVRAWKLWLLLGLFVAGLCLLAWRLWHVQVLDSPRYGAAQALQSIRRVQIPGLRGRILDRDGVILADNRPAYAIVIYCEELRQPGAWGNTILAVDTLIDQLAERLRLPRQVTSAEVARHVRQALPVPLIAWEDVDEKALAYVEKGKFPVVLKADGLALGKGVLICEDLASAKDGLKQIMLDKAFGAAGNKVVVEEFLTGKEFTPGEEVSVLAFTDGKTIVPMIASCDHKRALDGDKGLNTGGMGTFTPCPFYDKETADEVMNKIMLPTVAAMNAEGRPFKGVLYFGLMRTPDGMKVVEYNSRFGDPETQVVLPMLKTDLLEIFEAVTDERLADVKIEWEEGACVCVVLASGGYPVKYEKGKEITIGDLDEGVFLYHAGTKRENGVLKTSGGRVLGVCAKGKTVEEARKKAYANVQKIRFDGMHYRTDIGVKYNK